MSAENVEIILRLYQAMNERDQARAEELVHPDVEWVHDSRVGKGPMRGRESVLGYFRDQEEVFDELRIETERLWEKGDRVLAFVRPTGRGQASGAEFDIRIAHLWTLRDGVVVRGEGYGDRDEALEAAWVRE